MTTVTHDFDWFVQRNGLFIYNLKNFLKDEQPITLQEAIGIVTSHQEFFYGKADGIMREELSTITDAKKVPIAVVRIEVQVEGRLVFARGTSFTPPVHR